MKTSFWKWSLFRWDLNFQGGQFQNFLTCGFLTEKDPKSKKKTCWGREKLNFGGDNPPCFNSKYLPKYLPTTKSNNYSQHSNITTITHHHTSDVLWWVEKPTSSSPHPTQPQPATPPPHLSCIYRFRPNDTSSQLRFVQIQINKGQTRDLNDSTIGESGGESDPSNLWKIHPLWGGS